MQLERLEDIELVERYKCGRDSAFIAELYSRYAKRIYWWALKFLKSSSEAEEILQEIFAALMSGALDNYEARSGAKFSSWLYRCVANQCLKLMKSRNDALNGSVEIERVSEELTARVDLDGELALGERAERLNCALNRLNGMQRVCCMKFYWDGMKYDEIASELGITYDQVRSHLQNALRNLRLFLREAP